MRVRFDSDSHSIEFSPNSAGLQEFGLTVAKAKDIAAAAT